MAECAQTMVVFGATGDLARRKLAPALFRLCSKGRLPADVRIIGTASSELDDESFRELWRSGIEEFTDESLPDPWSTFAKRLSYVRVDLDDAGDGSRLESEIAELEGGEHAGRLYYLALPPAVFIPAVELLGAAGMADSSHAQRILVVEKPFGHDAASARALTDAVHEVFDERQVYRIDHYLGKETAQNLLYLRFANTIFEPLWNRNHVRDIQITVAETVDVADRARYYDSSGVLRDMFQNHLLQLLTLVAMEPPAPMTSKTVHDEKAKVLSAMRPVASEDTVFAQYDGYLGHEGVDAASRTPTYAAMRLWIDNWRWQGVPFHLQSGKALSTKDSTISIEFKRPPHRMFGQFQSPNPNVLAIGIQPDEGIHLTLDAKVPDQSEATAPVEMEFHYRDSFPGVDLPDAYERLLLDALHGDSTLFARQDEIELAWGLIDPVVAGLERQDAALPTYAKGAAIPDVAVEFLAVRGQEWRRGCGRHG